MTPVAHQCEHMPIQRLPPELVNQIAAGEVVQRPASVVKELLENSVDAGASRIEVEVEQGGVKLIRVRDNGAGIDKEDLLLALANHATSKITCFADLQGVTSLGFRGEALPSIAAVARLTLISRCNAQDNAWKVLAGERASQCPAPAAHPEGTTMEVRDLFYNLPARRKFLRTERAEFIHIETIVKRIALSHFTIALTLRHNQRLALALPCAHDRAEQERRLGELCGRYFVDNAVFLEREAAGLRLWGWIGLPNIARSQTDLQYVFVNGRIVYDKLIGQALHQAYQDVLYKSRYPACVLYIEMDPALVDVNVHPAKHEVRFREPGLICGFLQQAIKEALAKAHCAYQSSYEGSVKVVGAASYPIALRSPSIEQSQALPLRELAAGYARLQAAPTAAEATPPLGYAIAQLHGAYILAEQADGLVIVDIQAAYERIVYQRLQLELDREGVRSQPLIIPVTLTLSRPETEWVEREPELFTQLGLEMTPLGPEAVVVRRIPALLSGADIACLLQELFSSLTAQGAGVRGRADKHKLLAIMARHGAIRSVRRLTLTEMNALLRDLEASDNDQSDHGQPAWVRLTFAELNTLLRGC